MLRLTQGHPAEAVVPLVRALLSSLLPEMQKGQLLDVAAEMLKKKREDLEIKKDRFS